jgi:AmiR/NasT family two-component response regulator
LQTLKVLIVEDESLIAAGLQAQLKKIGHIVIGHAKDGQTAMAMVKKLNPDLVLMDINMPGMNGLEAAERLAVETPVAMVILTGYSEVSFINKASELGIEGYLVKPVTEEDLKPALELAYKNFRQKRKLREEVQIVKQDLENRKLVEQAKGIVMKMKGLTEAEAMVFLQNKSRDSRCKISEVARKIIKAAQLLE